MMFKRIYLNIILLVVTIITTTFAGAMLTPGDFKWSYSFILGGLPFSITLLSILGVHETAHYLASKHHNVEATLPYFIPVPPPVFMLGTFGAIIKIKSPIYNRKALFDIGFAGPAAGFSLALPLLVLGLSLSEVKLATTQLTEGLHLGNSLVMMLASKVVFGEIAEGYGIALHPIAFAAWIGMLVTAINLLPVGQLDGGHISYAVFGEKHIILSRIVFVIVVLMGVLWLGWLLWGGILLFALKLRHPPPIDPYTQLGMPRKKLAFAAAAIFVLTFIPIPFKLW